MSGLQVFFSVQLIVYTLCMWLTPCETQYSGPLGLFRYNVTDYMTVNVTTTEALPDVLRRLNVSKLTVLLYINQRFLQNPRYDCTLNLLNPICSFTIGAFDGKRFIRYKSPRGYSQVSSFKHLSSFEGNIIRKVLSAARRHVYLFLNKRKLLSEARVVWMKVFGNTLGHSLILSRLAAI